MLTDNERQDFSAALYQAWKSGEKIGHFSVSNPDITEADAYAIQLKNVDRMLADGHQITGKKIGLTSKAMQELFGVDVPDYGHLFDCMAVLDGAAPLNRLIQPKVEAEIAFILEQDLTGPNVTVADVLAATAFVAPALEIVDSRFLNWKIRLADTVADNGSSAMYVLGDERIRPADVSLPQVRMDFYRNDVLENSGSGAAVLGDPAECVAWLANKLSTFGVSLRAGEVILSGAITAAVVPERGDSFKAIFHDFGSAAVRFF